MGTSVIQYTAADAFCSSLQFYGKLHKHPAYTSTSAIHVLECFGKGGIFISDVELLARLIQCEAGGEGNTGMKAVASVVMNRVQVDYGEYGRVSNTIRDVIYQPGQFDCARTTLYGQYNPQNIYNMTPEQIHYDIAAWAIAGNRVPAVGYALWYFNPFSPICPPTFPSSVGTFVIRIGEHCFYNPTQDYAYT